MESDRSIGLVEAAFAFKRKSRHNCMSGLVLLFCFAMAALVSAPPFVDRMLWMFVVLSLLLTGGAAIATALAWGFMSWEAASDVLEGLPVHPRPRWAAGGGEDLQSFFHLWERAVKNRHDLTPGPAFNPFGPVFTLSDG